MDSVIQFRGTIYENGYGLIAQKVMRDKVLPKQSKLIYAYMCSFASINTDNGERTAFPSVSLQCDELGLSQDTYYKWRKPLVEKGFLTIEKRKSDEGKFERNIYFIESVIADKAPSEQEKEPYPKNKGTEEKPYPKNPSMDNPSTENKGTNSNRFNSNSFKSIDDDEYIINAIHENECFIALISYFEEKNMLNRKRDSLDVIRYLIKEEHTLFTMMDIESSYEVYKKEIVHGNITKKSSYFASLVIDMSEKNRMKKNYYDELEKTREQSRKRDKSIYFNWLEEK